MRYSVISCFLAAALLSCSPPQAEETTAPPAPPGAARPAFPAYDIVEACKNSGIGGVVTPSTQQACEDDEIKWKVLLRRGWTTELPPASEVDCLGSIGDVQSYIALGSCLADKDQVTK